VARRPLWPVPASDSAGQTDRPRGPLVRGCASETAQRLCIRNCKQVKCPVAQLLDLCSLCTLESLEQWDSVEPPGVGCIWGPPRRSFTAPCVACVPRNPWNSGTQWTRPGPPRRSFTAPRVASVPRNPWNSGISGAARCRLHIGATAAQLDSGQPVKVSGPKLGHR